MTSRPPRALRAPRALLAPLALLALAACGSPSNGPDVASAASSDASATPGASAASKPSSQGDVTKFAECMKKYGVDVTVNNDGNGGVGIRVKGGKPGDAGAMDKAQQECRQFAPGDAAGGDGKPMPKADQDKFLAFARCMREHGVPMQDPTFEGGGVRLRIDDKAGKGPTPDDATVQAAQKACQAILPEGGPKGAGSPGGSQAGAPAGAPA